MIEYGTRGGENRTAIHRRHTLYKDRQSRDEQENQARGSYQLIDSRTDENALYHLSKG